MAYQISKEALKPFRDAGRLLIPLCGPDDNRYSLSDRGKRPIKGLAWRRAADDFVFDYELFHNAGWVTRESAVVIDVDPRNGGVESVKRLQSDLGIVLKQACAGVAVRTGGGGAHYYFSLPEGFRCGTQRVLVDQGYDGVDIKGGGNAYVVIPGSKHSNGKMYEWATDQTIASGLAHAPSALLELIEKKEDDFVPLVGGIDGESNEKGDIERAKALAAAYEGAGSGERNESMYRLCNSLMDYGMGEQQTHEYLAVANDKNHPALSSTEIHDIYKKAVRYRKNDFGAKSILAEFDEVDVSVVMSDGERLSPEEARAQLSEVTGRDEAIKACAELLDAWDGGDGDMDLFDDIVSGHMNLIAKATDSVRRRIRRQLTEGGQRKVMSAADFDDYVKASQAVKSDDLPETIGMTVVAGHYESQKLRYSQGGFFTFNPNMWHRIDEKEVQNLVLDECNRLRSENPELGFSNAQVSMNALNIMKARTHIRPDKFFPHVDRQPPRVLNCTNGELWINDDGSMELKESSPASRMFHSLNVAWNPEAECPTYKRVLKEVFQHSDDVKDVIRHHLEMKGYHLSPRKPIPVIEVNVGSGANGKSLLNGDLVAGIVGRDSIGMGPLSMFRMDVPSTTARLENKLVWVDPDMDATRPLPAGLLKSLSENTMLTVEPKYMDAYNIMSLCSWVLLANELPISRDASKGLQRRMYLFEYGHDFSGSADLDLMDKLMAEKEGIFRLWVEGLVRVIKRVGFDTPTECVALREEWMSTQNIVGSFISERCESAPGVAVDTGEMYAEFVKFCTRDGTSRDEVMKRHTFTKRLKSGGRITIERRGANHGHVVVGLRLLPEWTAWEGDDLVENSENGELGVHSEGADEAVPGWL